MDSPATVQGALVSALRQSAEAGELSRVTRPGEIDEMLDKLMAQDWVVYAKPCLNHTDSVIDYLARYTHRIAITNARILSVDQSGVWLRYKDYAEQGRHKTIHLDRRGVYPQVPVTPVAQRLYPGAPLRVSGRVLPRTALGADPRGAGSGASMHRGCENKC